MIEPGQIYESCQPVRSEPGERRAQIRVQSRPMSSMPGLHGAGKVMVATLTTDGREIRPRFIEVTQLHESAMTKAGLPRRTGYYLVEDKEKPQLPDEYKLTDDYFHGLSNGEG
jgi:hypothetical protein